MLCKNSSPLWGLPPLDSCCLQVSNGTLEKIWICWWQLMKEEFQAWVILNMPPEGILTNCPLPTSSTNDGSTNTTDLAAGNDTLLQMASFAFSIWLQELLASLWILGYSQISCFKWIQVWLPAISTEISRSFGATPWRCSFTTPLNVVGWSIWWP